ncbi:MAG: pentapeptide repeat-containing protein [Fusobacteria bacterium]|nr:pentapeptide repeat-containing protein [Fusobacteriota bacterium]
MKQIIIMLMFLNFLFIYGEPNTNINNPEEVYCIDEVPSANDELEDEEFDILMDEDSIVDLDNYNTEENNNFNGNDLNVDIILSIINKGVSYWNQFREDYPNINYGDYKIKNVDFSDKNLTGINFSFMSFSNSKFMRANLDNSNLQGCEFIDCNFFKANIKNSDLKSVNAIRSSFKNVVLSNSDLDSAIISKIWKKSFKNKNIKNYKKISWR